MTEQKKELGFHVNSDTEQEIDLIDLFFSVLKKWRALLLLALVGILAGLAFGYYKANDEVFNLDDVSNKSAAETVDQLNLKYAKYQDALAQNGRSYLYNLADGKEYYSGKINYGLYTDNVDYSGFLDSAFNVMLDVKAVNEIKNILGMSQEDTAIDTMLSYSCSARSSTNISVGEAVVTNNKLVTYNLSYLTQEQCGAISEYLDGWLKKQVDFCVKQGIELKAEKISDGFSVMDGSAITLVKSDINAAAETAYKDYTDLVGKVKTNTNKIYGESTENIVEYHQYVTGQIEETSLKDTPSLMTVIKYGIIFAIVFGFVGVCWYGAVYVASDKVRSIPELSEVYGMNILTGIDSERQLKGIDKLIDRWSESRSGSEYSSVEYAAASILQLHLDRLCLCETMATAASVKICAELKKQIETETVSGMLNKDAELLNKACECGNVILVVTLGETRNSEIRAVLNVCRLHNICVAGVLAVTGE